MMGTDNGGVDISQSTNSMIIDVTSVNDAPVTLSDTATTNEETAVTINVLANDSDIDGDELQISVAADALPAV